MALVRMTSASSVVMVWLRMYGHHDLVAINVNFERGDLAVHLKWYGHPYSPDDVAF
jgi:hypothetical protein